jgi:hypothetical protein
MLIIFTEKAIIFYYVIDPNKIRTAKNKIDTGYLNGIQYGKTENVFKILTKDTGYLNGIHGEKKNVFKIRTKDTGYLNGIHWREKKRECTDINRHYFPFY